MNYDSFLTRVYTMLYDNEFVPATIGSMKSVGISLSNSSIQPNISYSRGRYSIELSRPMFYEHVLPDYSRVTKHSLDDVYDRTILLFIASFWHEMGHLYYTCFNLDYLRANANGKLEELMWLTNLLEDKVVEAAMAFKRPFLRKYFLEADEVCLNGEDKYVDDGSGDAFFSYLLYRLKKPSNTLTNQFYTDNEQEITDYIVRFYSCSEALDRQVVAVEFLQYLLSKGLEFKQPPPSLPQGTTSTGAGRATKETGSVPQEVGKDLSDQASSKGESKGESKDNGTGAGVAGDEAPDPNDSRKDGSDITSSGHSNTVVDNFDPKPILKGMLDSYLDLQEPNLIIKLRDVSISSEHEIKQFIDGTLSLRSDIIAGITDKFTDIEIGYQNSVCTGLRTGKFDSKAFFKGKEKFFKKNLLPVPDDDLAICIMVDMSGSMSGSKSALCAQAVLPLYDCLARLDIPFELHGFTRSRGTCYVYTIKGLGDHADNCLMNVPFLASNFCGNYDFPDKAAVFTSNIDEVSIQMVYNNFRGCGHSKKLLIVFSDGQTNGSKHKLATLIKDIEAEGTLTLGIGILHPTVAELYSHYHICETVGDLSKLPEFFGEMLINLKEGDF